MRFHRVARSRSQVPIVPMIDILFIVLVYLVVSTEQKRPRDILRIELPTVREVPSEQVTDRRAVIAVDALGNITLEDLRVPDGLLESYLAVFQKRNPGRKLELEADRKVPLQDLLSIWDSLRKAGIPVTEVPARIKIPDKPRGS